MHKGLAFLLTIILYGVIIAIGQGTNVVYAGVPNEDSPICTAPFDQSWEPDFPQSAEWPTYRRYVVTTDDNGGAIIVWYDDRAGQTNSDIYCQRVDVNGNASWGIDANDDGTKDGVSLCTAPEEQRAPVIVSDGAGGAIVAWHDERDTNTPKNRDIYAQRVNAAGEVQWAADGIPICTATDAQGNPKDQRNPTIASDGDGGAIIVWEDGRDPTGAIYTYAQRVDAHGNIKWPQDGVLIKPGGNGAQYHPVVIGDGLGGAFIATYGYTEYIGQPTSLDILVHRISANGTLLWEAIGCNAINDQEDPMIISDGAGGVIVAWEDYRVGGETREDIYAQRVSGDGLGLWEDNGVAICTAPEAQSNPILVRSVVGAVIVWNDYRNGNHDIYAQRVDGGGFIAWPRDGIAICTAEWGQSFPAIISDGEDGAIITWEDYRPYPEPPDIYAQRVDVNGNVLWGADGKAICENDSRQLNPVIVSGDACASGVIIAWMDMRHSATWDIYMKGICCDGSFPIVVFPDPNLEDAIRQAIYKPTGPICAPDLYNLTELYAHGRHIAPLAGLEHCTNLQALTLSDNEITDISPLANLTNLRWLDLHGNRISDVDPLAELTNLEILYLGDNQIIDLRALSELTSLQGLDLGTNQIADIAALSNRTNLHWLFLNDNQISEIEALADLINLENLYLNGNQIADIDALANLTNLGGLDLSDNQIIDLTPLANLINLQVLFLDRNGIDDISPLANLGQIGDAGGEKRDGVWIHLGLSGNAINNLVPLLPNRGIDRGDGVDLRDNPLWGVSYLAILGQNGLIKGRGLNVLYDWPPPQPKTSETDAWRNIVVDAMLSQKNSGVVPVAAGQGRVDAAIGSAVLETFEVDFKLEGGGETIPLEKTLEARGFSVTWAHNAPISFKAGVPYTLSGTYRATFADIKLNLIGTPGIEALAQSLQPLKITIATPISEQILPTEDTTLLLGMKLSINNISVRASLRDESRGTLLYSEDFDAYTSGDRRFSALKITPSTVVIENAGNVAYAYDLAAESRLHLFCKPIVVYANRFKKLQAAPKLYPKGMRRQTSDEDEAGEGDLTADSVLEGDIQWYNQHGQIPGATGDTLPEELADKLDEIFAVITTPEGQTEDSNQVLIFNNPPSLAKVNILASSDPPTVKSVLRAVPAGWEDADGDAESYLYQWFNQHGMIAGETNDTLRGKFARGDSIFALVAPFDGITYGVPVKSPTIIIKNTPPSLAAVKVDINPQKPTRESILTAMPTGWEDIDGDAENYGYEWFNQDGALIGTEATYNEKNVILDGSTTMKATVPISLKKGVTLNINLLGVQNGEVTIYSPSGDKIPLMMPEIEGGVAMGEVETQFNEVGEYRIDELYRLIIRTPPDSLFKIESPIEASFSWKYDNTEPGTRTFAYETKVNDIKAQITGPLEGEVDVPKPEANFVLDVTISEDISAGGTIEAAINSQAGFYKKSVVEISGVALKGPILTGRNFIAGDNLYVKVTPFDGIDRGISVESTEVLILNTPPSINSVTIKSDTTPPTVISKLEAKIEGWRDVDEDEERIQYEWYTPAGKIQDATEATLQGMFKKGDEIYVIATPTDGKDVGEAKTSPKLAIVNTRPTKPKVAIRPTQPTEEDDLACEIVEPSADADGDDIAYNVKWYKNNKEQKDLEDKQTVDTKYTVAGERWRCKVVATDGEANSSVTSSATATIKEKPKNTPPSITSVAIQPGLAYVGDILNAVPKGWEDAEGDEENYQYQWQIHREGQWADVGADATFDTSKVADESTIKVMVTPYDGTDKGEPQTASITLGGIISNDDDTVVARIPPKTIKRTDVRVVLETSTDSKQVKQAGENSVGYYAPSGDFWQLNIYDVEGKPVFDEVTEGADVTIKLYYSEDIPGFLVVDLTAEVPFHQKAETTVDTEKNYIQATVAWQTAFAPGKSATPANPGDVNGDGNVDISDLVLIGAHFGERIITPPANNPDANRDRIVDISDLVLVGRHLGE